MTRTPTRFTSRVRAETSSPSRRWITAATPLPLPASGSNVCLCEGGSAERGGGGGLSQLLAARQSHLRQGVRVCPRVSVTIYWRSAATAAPVATDSTNAHLCLFQEAFVSGELVQAPSSAAETKLELVQSWTLRTSCGLVERRHQADEVKGSRFKWHNSAFQRILFDSLLVISTELKILTPVGFYDAQRLLFEIVSKYQ